MYNQHPEYEALIARQRYDGYLKELDEIRLAAQLPPRPSLLRQGANWSGQMCFSSNPSRALWTFKTRV